ncbi:hypothetical protein TRV_00554 [Trichophyton verrucosum HKI 0517]|uniref:Uncharacterized protein n=1 Tax=Trichophyton verrucosum (strain HKI 0517) TaxID=663202 RepID=D4D0F9_TRIVH|nr:uncharacterized protein TRV_00554 [Trichophyton verrucosum HKI 0517]EFE44666.1 hypothetical protein TRV_00554 [Trichophyton verrucosum HKI 0517]
MADLNRKAPETIDSPLLIGLPEGTLQIEYTNMEDIRCLVDKRAQLCCLDSSKSPFIIVINIPHTFLQDFDNVYLDKGPKISTNLQDRVLILETMVAKEHEVAARGLEGYLRERIRDMKLNYITTCSGASRATSDTFTKEPDGSFTLQDRDWPILAIEAGVYECESKLNIDARGWLESPKSETEVVITIKIERLSPEITFKKWEKSSSTPERGMCSYQPAISTETIHVKYQNDVTEITGDMVIPLAKIAGRGPQNSNENDITVTKAAFEEICKEVWTTQNLL